MGVGRGASVLPECREHGRTAEPDAASSHTAGLGGIDEGREDRDVVVYS